MVMVSFGFKKEIDCSVYHAYLVTHVILPTALCALKCYKLRVLWCAFSFPLVSLNWISCCSAIDAEILVVYYWEYEFCSYSNVKVFKTSLMYQVSMKTLLLYSDLLARYLETGTDCSLFKVNIDRGRTSGKKEKQRYLSLWEKRKRCRVHCRLPK